MRVREPAPTRPVQAVRPGRSRLALPAGGGAAGANGRTHWAGGRAGLDSRAYRLDPAGGACKISRSGCGYEGAGWPHRGGRAAAPCLADRARGAPANVAVPVWRSAEAPLRGSCRRLRSVAAASGRGPRAGAALGALPAANACREVGESSGLDYLLPLHRYEEPPVYLAGALWVVRLALGRTDALVQDPPQGYSAPPLVAKVAAHKIHVQYHL